MVGSFRDYIWECIKEAPSAWRRGMIAVTLLTYIVIAAALLLGWHLNALSNFQLATGALLVALLEILVILPFKLWKANTAKIDELEDRIKSKIRLSFSMNEPGCVRPNTYITAGPDKDVVATWYRIKVEALGVSALTGCRGRLVALERGSSNLLLGETPSLSFAQGDGLSKIISPGVPEYLDFLVANDTHGAHVPVVSEHLSQAVRWNELFSIPGDHRLRIVVVPRDCPPASIDLL